MALFFARTPGLFAIDWGEDMAKHFQYLIHPFQIQVFLALFDFPNNR
jgi:hypothetical protein